MRRLRIVAAAVALFGLSSGAQALSTSRGVAASAFRPRAGVVRCAEPEWSPQEDWALQDQVKAYSAGTGVDTATFWTVLTRTPRGLPSVRTANASSCALLRAPACSCVLYVPEAQGSLLTAPHARYAHEPRAYRAYRDTPVFGARSLRMCQHCRRATPPNSRHAPRSWRSMAARRCCARSAPPTQPPFSSICTRCLLLPACALLEARERLQPHASCLQDSASACNRA